MMAQGLSNESDQNRISLAQPLRSLVPRLEQFDWGEFQILEGD
jgi:hypothetical protein